MRVELFQSFSGGQTLLLIAGDLNSAFLTEDEARELCGKLPNVLDPITPSDPVAPDTTDAADGPQNTP